MTTATATTLASQEFATTDWASRQLARVCSRCKEEKPYTAFRVHKRGARTKCPGRVCRSTTCKDCAAQQVREWSAKHPERRKVHSHRCHRKQLLRKYGLDEMQYQQMLAAQGGCCAICGGLRGKYKLAVDHDHTTGVVRGLLCQPCNRALGYFKDSPSVLQAATTYLQKHGKSLND